MYYMYEYVRFHEDIQQNYRKKKVSVEKKITVIIIGGDIKFNVQQCAENECTVYSSDADRRSFCSCSHTLHTHQLQKKMFRYECESSCTNKRCIRNRIYKNPVSSFIFHAYLLSSSRFCNVHFRERYQIFRCFVIARAMKSYAIRMSEMLKVPTVPQIINDRSFRQLSFILFSFIRQNT